MRMSKTQKLQAKLMKIGDLIWDEIFHDLALVLETPKECKNSPHFKLYYCTGPVAGQISLEPPASMECFIIVSKGKDD